MLKLRHYRGQMKAMVKILKTVMLEVVSTESFVMGAVSQVLIQQGGRGFSNATMTVERFDKVLYQVATENGKIRKKQVFVNDFSLKKKRFSSQRSYF